MHRGSGSVHAGQGREEGGQFHSHPRVRNGTLIVPLRRWRCIVARPQGSNKKAERGLAVPPLYPPTAYWRLKMKTQKMSMDKMYMNHVAVMAVLDMINTIKNTIWAEENEAMEQGNMVELDALQNEWAWMDKYHEWIVKTA